MKLSTPSAGKLLYVDGFCQVTFPQGTLHEKTVCEIIHEHFLIDPTNIKLTRNGTKYFYSKKRDTDSYANINS